MIYRKHHLVPINHVNPIDINDLEPLHMVVGSPIANHLAWAKIANHPGFAEAKLRLRQGELAWAKIANHPGFAKASWHGPKLPTILASPRRVGMGQNSDSDEP